MLSGPSAPLVADGPSGNLSKCANFWWPHRADFAGGPARPARPPEPTHIGSRSPYLRRIYRVVGKYRGPKSLVVDSCDEWSATRDERAHPRAECSIEMARTAISDIHVKPGDVYDPKSDPRSNDPIDDTLFQSAQYAVVKRESVKRIVTVAGSRVLSNSRTFNSPSPSTFARP